MSHKLLRDCLRCLGQTQKQLDIANARLRYGYEQAMKPFTCPIMTYEDWIKLTDEMIKEQAHVR